MSMNNKIGQVVSCSPICILVEIKDLESFENNKEKLQLGSYLKIAQGNCDFTIASIRNIKGEHIEKEDSTELKWKFFIECQAIGTLVDDEFFERGSLLLPVPTEPVYLPDENTINKIFISDENYNFPFGNLTFNRDVTLKINGNSFFSKHIAVVGSTGSGKSCTVAKILHNIVGIDCDSCYTNANQKNNSHIVIFDLHDEYSSAFSLEEAHDFTLNRLDVNTLKLPYWLMNSEELESMFIESNEENSHNQVSQFKHAVILNKEKHNPNVKEMTYDTPVYFSIEEVYNYIENMNREIIDKEKGKYPAINGIELSQETKQIYFEKIHEFKETERSKKVTGPFYGKFDRFVSRLETKLADKRLDFLLHPKKDDGQPYKTEDFNEIMKQYIGYLNKANVTIVDLSGIPFEVLSITVSLISRLIFDFCFHYTKLRHENDKSNDIPVMIVCEEAHNYVPQNDNVDYRASRKSIERIAKEGRKYGISLMVVSQRPSEVSETIFAQCNNFVALRLTNNTDQMYVKRLFPDNSSGITDILPNLAPGECIIVGDAVLLPSVVQMEIPKPQPASQSVKFHKEWSELWKDVTFEDVIKRWRRE